MSEKFVDLETFETILEKYAESELKVYNSEGKLIREGKIIVIDNHYDWDKNRVDSQPYNKCRWNGKDKIWDWVEGHLTSGAFTVIGDELVISSAKQTQDSRFTYWYRIKVHDGKITCGHFSGIGQSEIASITKLYDIDVIEKSINDFIKFVSGMDIDDRIKEIVFNKVKNAKYEYTDDYVGYRRESPELR